MTYDAPQPRKGDELERQYDAILLKHGFVIEPDNYFQNEARKDFVALCHKRELIARKDELIKLRLESEVTFEGIIYIDNRATAIAAELDKGEV